MNELFPAFVVHELRRSGHTHRTTHHAHQARVFRLSRPGEIGTLAQLAGDSRMSVVWRSNR